MPPCGRKENSNEEFREQINFIYKCNSTKTPVFSYAYPAYFPPTQLLVHQEVP